MESQPELYTMMCILSFWAVLLLYNYRPWEYHLSFHLVNVRRFYPYISGKIVLLGNVLAKNFSFVSNLVFSDNKFFYIQKKILKLDKKWTQSNYIAIPSIKSFKSTRLKFHARKKDTFFILKFQN